MTTATNARAPLTEEVLIFAYTLAMAAVGGNMTHEKWRALPEATRESLCSRMNAVLERGENFATRSVLWPVLNKGPLEANELGSARKIAVAYKVGFISFETMSTLLAAHFGRPEGDEVLTASLAEKTGR